MDPWSRRRFLAAGAASFAVGCAGVGPVVREPVREAPRATVRRPAVAVVGGGFAGLMAAWSLGERGYEVTVLEARERAGGRILTLREPFEAGAFVEAGALHIVGDPELLRVLAALGISLERRRSGANLSRVVYFGNERRVVPAGVRPPRPRAWSEEEEALGEDGCMQKYFALSKSFDPTLPPPAAFAGLDWMTGAEFLREAGASDGFVAEMDGMLGLGDAGLEGMSALALVQQWAEILREIGLGGGGFVAGGTDRITSALSAKLGERLRLGAVVTGIEQSERGVRVRYRRRGQEEVVSAERAVLAIPAPLLRELAVTPALSPAKRRALAEIELESVTRVWLQTRSRFWLERGEAGRVDSDGPLGPARDESEGQPGDKGILGLYVKRSEAKRLARLPQAARLAESTSYLDLLQPGAASEVVAGLSHAWDADPFQRGAYAYFKPGQVFEIAPELARREGRLHFAGDHTSHRPGFLHGALASATRVVDEVTLLQAAPA